MDVWSIDLNIDILNVNGESGNNAGGGNYGGDQNSSSGSNTQGPQGPEGPRRPRGPQDWRPFHYPDYAPRENGRHYPADSASPMTILQTFNPESGLPPQNDKQLGVLLDYRFHCIRDWGYYEWNVKNIFPNDDLVDRISRERIIAHIHDFQRDLPTAYKQLDMASGTPKLHKVEVTSYLINSLNHSTR